MLATRKCLVLVVLGSALYACGGDDDDDQVTSDEEAAAAYLGLDEMVGKAMDLGFQGFNAASSANIPAQSTSGAHSGTLTVSGKVDQGASNNKEMDLILALVDYSDDTEAVNNEDRTFYNTSAAPNQPTLGLSLKKIPDGTLSGSLSGTFHMSGRLEGDVTLALTLSGQLEAGGGAGKTQRKPGTTSITGTATSPYGTYAVNIKI